LHLSSTIFSSSLFFFPHAATSQIYTLSLHDALPIYLSRRTDVVPPEDRFRRRRTGMRRALTITLCGLGLALAPSTGAAADGGPVDRKSTRLNSSHQIISYAVFCLKKKTTSDRYRSR